MIILPLVTISQKLFKLRQGRQRFQIIFSLSFWETVRGGLSAATTKIMLRGMSCTVSTNCVSRWDQVIPSAYADGTDCALASEEDHIALPIASSKISSATSTWSRDRISGGDQRIEFAPQPNRIRPRWKLAISTRSRNSTSG